MRALYLGLAAALCVAALAFKLFNISDIAAVLALLVAGVFLVLGLKMTAAIREPKPIVLDEEKRETLRAMLERDDEGAAVRQVQLWFRDATPESARAVVQDLR
ncbi:MAG: hypothetical protein Q4G50_11810 [Corynebacterium sp.]|uniref:hypothetical protein n=1 Tax=Corynebacterium sp. TaxID=1720 RepID=UPI0026DEB25A|nr:hypothetical protein [Corynebacterium sp.]MDO5670670.1 hypothetical protein [Corynebacterium sp.]